MASPLSSDTAYVYSYRGFRNLALLILVVSNLRLVIENVTKYGLLVDVWSILVGIATQDFSSWPTASMAIGLSVFIAAAWVIELLASGSWLPSGVASLAHAVNVAASLAIPCLWIWYIPSNEVLALILVLSAITLFLKLWSYATVNARARAQFLERQVAYPANVTPRNIIWFLAAPTLCYQINYPQTAGIRPGFLLRRTAEFFFFSGLIFMLAQQYMVPTVANTMAPLQAHNYIKVAERLLKIAVPNFLIWILGFYTYFHVYLNIWAEVTAFGDRVFYKDWWNSTTLSRFWRAWNIPVHNWLVQNIYLPLRTLGASKQVGYVACFFFSALLHELIIDVAFRSLGWLAFAGMMLQIPSCLFTDQFEGTTLGNVIMWLSLLLGQPLCILGYYAAIVSKTQAS
ncbi:diacylglycerol O-acyltransferase 1 [Thecamonas trahens ATCC 50062]|uniref:diacylglycerol O-acyltransferase n=1 Tax=Thecamonas trahens ATCC 50062 TaxID=461836 RepID=A0A0L0DGH1_THETB|nr:diacylglycerol O-acyltransferase 1 [Thecamonas trahens ATCC 50062]KNC51216.1 diacylglycerol O-acyltransferase 1 [Thecamonas trahens ATCC 50062]|eukprot:XP_013756413.1 diacylglycerol O-acyltransferase 1 [Thecamonas trahens ATCC 50062]